MKLIAVLLTAAFLNVHASGRSQTVTLTAENIRLKEVFSIIKKQTGFVVFYNVSDLTGTNPVSIDVSGMPLPQFLDIVFKNQPLGYTIEAKTIMLHVRSKPVAQAAVKTDPIPADTTIIVSGRITNDQGEPLEGVTVHAKFSDRNVVSDAGGAYKISLTRRDRALIFSFVGYENQESLVNGRNVINIVLNKVVRKLDQIVIIGYGKQKRRDLTGSIASLQSDEITRTKVPTFQEAIQGKIAGVRISASSGEPGAAMNISIRGANSIYAASTPLYVIDGVPYDANSSEMVTANIGNKTVSNPLSNINPNDIESIDVLKDASATAIYGSRGANGVIIITTKTGKSGAPRLVYNAYAGVSSPTKRLDILNADEYIQFMKITNPNSALFYYDTNKDGLFNSQDQPRNLDSLKRHDYQKEVLRKAFTQSHNISLSGSNNGTTYSAAVGYLDQEAIVRKNKNKRFTLRTNISRDFGQKLKIGLNMSTSDNMFDGPSHSGGGAGLFNGVVQNLIQSRPIEFYDPTWDRTSGYYSPLSMIDQAYKSMVTLQNMVNATLNYKITPDLTLNLMGGSIWTDSKGKEFYGKNTDWGVIDKGLGTIQNSKSRYINNTNQLVYDKKLGSAHSINAMVAMELGQYDFEYFNVSKSNFANEETGIDDISKGSVAKGSASSRDISRRISYFGRINYSLLNRHLFTATFRADGSDKFGNGRRFGYFPSFAYAWIASDESFLRNSATVSNLKLRLSYGETGNERIPSFRYLPTLSNAYYQAVLGFAPSSRANPDLRWEATSQYNLGFDLGLFKNRVSLSVDLYDKRTSDMLIEAYVPARTGYSTQWMNIGSIRNKGIEVLLSTKNIDRKDLSWESNITFSSNRNRVKSIGNLDFIPVIVGGSWIDNVGRVTVGQAIGTGYGYKYAGVYQISDFTWQNGSDPSIPHASRNYVLKSGVVSIKGINVRPGFSKFKDLSGDNVVDLDHDRTTISRSEPKFFGGVNNTFRFKNFDLNIFFEGSYGNQVMNVSKYQLEGAYPNAWMNISRDFFYNRWTPDNPTNRYGDFNSVNTNSKLVSDYYVEDASYLRLKNITVGYSFDANVLRKMRIQGLHIYVSGSNLHTWTKYTGFDPEVQSGEPLLQGLDRISYPRSKSFNFGVDLTF